MPRMLPAGRLPRETNSQKALDNLGPKRLEKITFSLWSTSIGGGFCTNPPWRGLTTAAFRRPRRLRSFTRLRFHRCRLPTRTRRFTMNDPGRLPIDSSTVTRRGFLKLSGAGVAGGSLLTMLDAHQGPRRSRARPSGSERR